MFMKKFALMSLMLISGVMCSYLDAATYKDALMAADRNVTANHANAIKDPTYPTYHLRPPSGWNNDPCGLFYYNSSFHVFTESNPFGSTWGNMSWSHIYSPPNEKWNYKWCYPVRTDNTYKTTTIIPSLNKQAIDANGIFTGCVNVLPFKEKDQNGNTVISYYPTAIYSAVWGTNENLQEGIAMARAMDANKFVNNQFVDPYLTNWTKISKSKNDPDNNPKAIIKQPTDPVLFSFRDPFLFVIPNDSNYYLITSAGTQGQDSNPLGVIMLFKNKGRNLTKNWTRVNSGNDFFFSAPVAIKDPVTNGGDFECGVVYRLTDHIGSTNGTPDILIFGQDGSPSTPYGKSVYYVLGKVVKSGTSIHFVPLDSFKNTNGGVIMKHLDLNPDFVFYATNLLPVDNEMRNYLIGWLNIGSQANDGNKYDWAGALSITRFLFAYKENDEFKLGQEPALVNALRREVLYSNHSLSFAQKNEFNLDGAKGRSLNISAVFKSSNIISADFGFNLANNSGGYFPVRITNGCLFAGKDQNGIDLDLPASGQVKIDAYLDGAILELFISKYVNGNFISYRTYSSALPSYGNVKNDNIKIFGSGDVTASVDVYAMDTCWTKDKTQTTGKPLSAVSINNKSKVLIPTV
ncbi:hypothetical protein P0136_12445 [Lentisphaerota bacterium ZTH]|nr:hypothetical protein JYG24_10040 [Lentisphaerota bacterium]WET06167.1 hypothetical protein P0136_12445 [Lentisphaerota bacterium ZTH]